MFNPLFTVPYFIKRKIAPGFKIPKNSLVLDVGSGNLPFWRGDVFLDDLKYGNIQRHLGQNTISSIGLFVDSDASIMPFKDKVFDFSFCSHLLEHVTNPASVINEITRVSKRGYIEVPNGIIETIHPFHSHLWLIYYAEDTLYFVRKRKYMQKVFLLNGIKFRNLITKAEDPFIRICWVKNIKYKIIDSQINDKFTISKKDVIQLNKEENNLSLLYITIVKLLRRLFYKKKIIKSNLFSI